MRLSLDKWINDGTRCHLPALGSCFPDPCFKKFDDNCMNVFLMDIQTKKLSHKKVAKTVIRGNKSRLDSGARKMCHLIVDKLEVTAWKVISSKLYRYISLFVHVVVI